VRTSLNPAGCLLFICYLGFVSLGLPDTLVGIAWPSVRTTFSLQQSDVAWIFFGSGCSYLLSSVFAGRLLKLMSVGSLLAGSSLLVGLSGLNFGLAHIWALFACGALLHGLGSGAIDAGLNHYVANHFSARHMNWLHACYSLGAMIGPLIMTAMIAWTHTWRAGYLLVASVLLVLAVLFGLTRRLWNDPVSTSSGAKSEPVQHISTVSAFRNRLVWCHVALFFTYAGIEVGLGQWSFSILTESRGINAEVAGIWVAIYWGSILGGRILFGFIVDKLDLDFLVRASMATVLAGTALFAWNPLPLANPIALVIAGIGLAPIYPCLMTRTPQRLGKQVAAHAIGFQVAAAMIGVAVLPSATGLVAQYLGLSYAGVAVLALAVLLFALHEGTVAVARFRP
jgi:fucose permease